jgi:hypothetical protein
MRLRMCARVRDGRRRSRLSHLRAGCLWTEHCLSGVCVSSVCVVSVCRCARCATTTASCVCVCLSSPVSLCRAPFFVF